MIWKLNHGLAPIKFSPANHARAGFRTSCTEAYSMSRPVTHIEAMCGWSMSLTRFGVAKLRAAVKAMLKQYDGAGIQVATQWRITSLVRVCLQNKLRFFSLFGR
jgi:hypothetical protein